MKKVLDKHPISVVQCLKCGASEDQLEVRYEPDYDAQEVIPYIYCWLCSNEVWEK